MAKTPATSASSYCSAAEFLKRIDKRTVADLCSDTGTPVTEGALAANVNLLAALEDASGDVEAAALMGGRYSNADLAALITDDGVGAAKLRRIVSDLAIAYLFERRPSPDLDRQPQAVERALKFLELLASGERIFGFQEVMDDGVMDDIKETPAIVEARNLPTYIARRLFGRRANRTSQGSD